MPFVFTKREISHCDKFQDPAPALCASFCIKEAMFKALGKAYNFTDCEFFPNTAVTGGRFSVSHRLLDKGCTLRPVAMLPAPVQGHITAIVYLVKKPS
jgi:phosphopantetheinyl transferase (holo-ACP synthase)